MNIKNLAKFLAFCFLVSCTPTSTTEPPPTIAPTETPSPTPLPTFTLTPSLPMLLPRAEVPCYGGPGETYELVANLPAGQRVEIVGKAGLFWVVKLPSNIECWVADARINVEGEVSTLPNVPSPATPTPSQPSIPNPPSNFKLENASCWLDKTQGSTMYVYEFWLAWTDTSSDEAGFRVYRDGRRAAEVSANTEKVIVRQTTRWLNTIYYFYVTAYNELGESKSEVLPLTCSG